MRKAEIKYIHKEGEPTLEQKLKAYQKISRQIAIRKAQKGKE